MQEDQGKLPSPRWIPQNLDIVSILAQITQHSIRRRGRDSPRIQVASAALGYLLYVLLSNFPNPFSPARAFRPSASRKSIPQRATPLSGAFRTFGSHVMGPMIPPHVVWPRSAVLGECEEDRQCLLLDLAPHPPAYPIVSPASISLVVCEAAYRLPGWWAHPPRMLRGADGNIATYELHAPSAPSHLQMLQAQMYPQRTRTSLTRTRKCRRRATTRPVLRLDWTRGRGITHRGRGRSRTTCTGERVPATTRERSGYGSPPTLPQNRPVRSTAIVQPIPIPFPSSARSLNIISGTSLSTHYLYTGAATAHVCGTNRLDSHRGTTFSVPITTQSTSIPPIRVLIYHRNFHRSISPASRKGPLTRSQIKNKTLATQLISASIGISLPAADYRSRRRSPAGIGALTRTRTRTRGCGSGRGLAPGNPRPVQPGQQNGGVDVGWPKEGVNCNTNGIYVFPRVPTGTRGSRENFNDDPYPYPADPYPQPATGRPTRADH
ncbi:hypothetical protein C8F04DRAFT_1190633 [Mycena alexandri]|uniref:Uncharacterized protein n=1 Tax=Mycena alexandri TaxID=1745969 RepID=A0AAD6SFL8_9AGAR|nr:hypothetical protein C8F04DRAFT_1190633 [Mycena alexandri]